MDKLQDIQFERSATTINFSKIDQSHQTDEVSNRFIDVGNYEYVLFTYSTITIFFVILVNSSTHATRRKRGKKEFQKSHIVVDKMVHCIKDDKKRGTIKR